jgi:hypothetical protein
MIRKLFIPKKCRVGFQHRSDTFTGKLAYVIYYDSLGKIRKETSWKGWCHLPPGHDGWRKHTYRNEARELVEVPGIEPFDFPNDPTSGFVINKGVQRINWSHFGSGRSMCRIYDPRGIEIEINIENLCGILMHTDCLRREIQGELVYAWCGGDLMLLPCNSEEYQKARSYTELQTKKVGARELKEGLTYVTKNEEHLVYIGRHMWHEVKDRRQGQKHHIFCGLDGKNFRPVKNVSSTIAAVSNEHPHDETANWIDIYLKELPYSAEIVEWIKEPIPEEVWNQDWDVAEYGWPQHRLQCFMLAPDNAGFYCTIIQKFQRHQRTHYSNTPSFAWRQAELARADAQSCLVYARHSLLRLDGSTRYLNSNARLYSSCDPGEGQVTDRSLFFNLKARYSNGLIKQWSEND